MKRFYETIENEKFDTKVLSDLEYKFLKKIMKYYSEKPDWNVFSNYWLKEGYYSRPDHNNEYGNQAQQAQRNQTIAREKEIARSQITGKPENIIDKIITGKLNKWYQQVVLLEQPFVKDDSKTVRQLLDEVSQAAGGKLSVKRFTRLQIG